METLLFVRIHIEDLTHCDAVLSLIRYSKINWYSNYFSKAERNLERDIQGYSSHC